MKGINGNWRCQSNRSGICNAYQRGECSRGDSCRFSHNEGRLELAKGFGGRYSRKYSDGGWKVQSSWEGINLNTELPNTERNSKHEGLMIGCFKCGACVAQGTEVYEVKNNAIWTQVCTNMILDSKISYNDCKKTNVQSVFCRYCNNTIGSYYHEQYFDSETQEMTTKDYFPCVMITYRRKNKGNVPVNQTVLLGDDDSIGLCIANLTKTEDFDQEFHKILGNVRVDTRTHDAILYAKQAHKAKQDAEARELASRKEAEDKLLASQIEMETFKIALKAIEDRECTVSSKKVVWECATEDGWLAFNSENNDLLELKYKQSFLKGDVRNFALERESIPYIIDFRKSTQKRNDGYWSTERAIRRREVDILLPDGGLIYGFQGNLQTLVRYRLQEKREFDLNDRLDIHYRIAASQFLKFDSSLTLEYVELVENPALIRKWKAKKEEFKRVGKDQVVLAFHGTRDMESITSIITNNFDSKFIGSATDCSYYGRGFYFSEYPQKSLTYGENLLLCQLLPGKAFDVTTRMDGRPITASYDSHRFMKDEMGRGQELVIADPDQILPLYILHVDT